MGTIVIDHAQRSKDPPEKMTLERLVAEREKIETFRESQELAFAQLQKEADKMLGEMREQLDQTREELASLKSSETAIGFSQVFSQKVKSASCVANLFTVLYVIVVVLAISFALYNCNAFHQEVKTFQDFLDKGLATFVFSLPVYAFLLWLAYAAKKRISESRRLAEAYSHKMYFGKAIVGLSQQIRMIEKSDPELGKNLKAKLTDALIAAYGKDASQSSFDKTCETPVGEISDGIANVIKAIATLNPAVKTP